MATNYLEDYGENTFFVDTKNICFLCLAELPVNDIQTIYVGDSDHVSLSEEDGLKDTLCLRQIIRYLKLDTRQLFDSALANLTAQPLDQMSDFSVVLCRECATVSRQLSTLSEELEMIQGKVQQCLKRFHEKLSAGSSQALVQVDEERNEVVSPFGLEVPHAMVADILREKTKAKCSVRLKNMSSEKEAISTTSSNRKSKPILAPTTCSTTSSIIKIKTEPAPEDLILLPDTIVSPLESASDSASSLSFKLPTMAEIPQQRDDNNLVTCCLCPPTSNSVFGKELLFQRHVTCCHLDYLFSSVKFPCYSTEQFKAYCEYLLEEEIKLCEQGDINKKKNTDENPGFICYICGDIFHEVKVNLVHLVQSHHGVLAKKLVELQDSKLVNPDQLLQKKRSEIFVVEGPKYKCEDCGRVFIALSSLSRHQKTPCKKRSTNVKVRPFVCDLCGLRFTSQHGKRVHTKRIHMGIDHNRYRVTCELCGKTMSGSSLGRHKRYSCAAVLGSGSKEPSKPMVNGKSKSSSKKVKSQISGQSSRDPDSSYFVNEHLKIEVVEEEEDDVLEIEQVNKRNTVRQNGRKQQIFTRMVYNGEAVVNDQELLEEDEMDYEISESDLELENGMYDEEEDAEMMMLEMTGEEEEDEDPLQ